MELKVRNVNQAFKEAWWKIRTYGEQENSRNGPVLVLPEPLLTTYTCPAERVLFSPQRDANAVFHLMETIWMFAGRNDVEWLLPFNANYANYAEQNGVVHGAYGHRWRGHFSRDQILEVIHELRERPNSRRAVIAMWDPLALDMTHPWKDTPCNTHIYFDLRGGVLNMTVCCRSNDMLWGAYGANVVHFSLLQELIAQSLNAELGVYRQFSNNFHVYTGNEQAKSFLDSPPYDDYDYYRFHATAGPAETFTLLMRDEQPIDFLRNCEDFILGKEGENWFLNSIAAPLRDAYLARKAGQPWNLDTMPECDWKIAFEEWAARRAKK